MGLIDKQKIKTALEQRLKQYKNTGGFFTGCIEPSASAIDYYYLECKEILALVDSMPEEPLNDDLEKEISRWLEENCDDAGYFNQIEFARHFVNWQKQRDAEFRENNNICCMKFDDIEDARLGAYEEGKKDMKQQMTKEAIMKILPPDLREVYENAEVPDMSDDFKARLVSAITRERPEDEEFTKTQKAKNN